MLYKLIIVVLFLIILYHLYNKKNIEGFGDCWSGTEKCSDDDCNINNLKILECQNNKLKELYNHYRTLPETAKIANLETLYCIIPNKEIDCIQEMLITPQEIKLSLLNGVPERSGYKPEEERDAAEYNKKIEEEVSIAKLKAQ
tara:strand:+ start:242 stop:670 length:429 start_codon:yes stop_codon:yes gene_type:complete